METELESIIPVLINQFDPIKLIQASTEEQEIQELRIKDLITQTDNPALAQMLIYNYAFTQEDAKSKAIIAPKSIIGPRQIIDAKDITPGMQNIGYIKKTENVITTTIIDSVITEVTYVDGAVHVKAGEMAIRDTAGKTWFIQHIWKHSRVVRKSSATPGRVWDYRMESEEAVDGEYMMSIKLNAKNPRIEISEYGEESYGQLLSAHEGTRAAYYLWPRIQKPRMSTEPIPPMPGQPQPQPEPNPEAEEATEKPGPAIPPMPGTDESWEKPKTADWWIS